MMNVNCRRLQIQALFRAILRREPDSVSLLALDLFLRRGGTLEEIKAMLLGSSEYFYQRCGGCSEQFLAILYQDVLGRCISAEMLQQALRALENGMSRNAFAYHLVTSREADQKMVQGLYRQLLQRDACSREIDFYVQLLQTGRLDVLGVSYLIEAEQPLRSRAMRPSA